MTAGVALVHADLGGDPLPQLGIQAVYVAVFLAA
jgi:hypothetical protein